MSNGPEVVSDQPDVPRPSPRSSHKDFAAFLSRSPDTASVEDVRRFQLHLAESGAHTPILNHTVSALRFFFRVTLKRHDIIEHTTFIREPRKPETQVITSLPPQTFGEKAS